MSTHRPGDLDLDTDRILADFLAEEAPPHEPPVLLPALLARTALTRRRPAWRIPSWWLPANLAWHPRTPGRSLTMFSAVRVVAAVVILAIVSGTFFVNLTNSPSPAGLTSSPSPSPSPSALPFPDPGAVAPGTYSDGRWTVTIPEGWEWFYSYLWSDLGGPSSYLNPGGPGEVALGWYEVVNVYADPCHWKDSLSDPPIGPTVDDLANALVAQVGRAGTGPTDVIFAGYPAKKVELSVPADLDVTTCDEGVYREVLGVGESPLHADPVSPGQANIAGQLSVLYILDIGGTRTMLNTWHHPETSAQDMAELEAMLGSSRIDPPAPSVSPAPSPSASS